MGKIILSTKSPSGSDLKLYSFCRFGIAEPTTSGFIGRHFVLQNALSNIMSSNRDTKSHNQGQTSQASAG